jgi:pre-rRNA-processing protein TSR1
MKIHSTDTFAEAALLARAVCEAAPTGGKDDGRGYLVAEGTGGVTWSEAEGSSAGRGRMEVVGTVRGGCLSADRLVHIPGKGDFQIESVGSSPLGVIVRLISADTTCTTIISRHSS